MQVKLHILYIILIYYKILYNCIYTYIYIYIVCVYRNSRRQRGSKKGTLETFLKYKEKENQSHIIQQKKKFHVVIMGQHC